MNTAIIIDGFNYYHSIRNFVSQGKLEERHKWLNYYKLGKAIAGKVSNYHVFFCTPYL